VRQALDLYRELNARRHAARGDTAAAVRALAATAAHYLQSHPTNLPCRFDVISISTAGRGFEAELIRDAFEL